MRNILQRIGQRLPLRWHLIGAQMAVVLVGVVTLTVVLEWVLRHLDPSTIEATIATFPGITGAPITAESRNALLDLVRQGSFRALFVAALAATVTGLVTSLVLTREILRSLHALAQSSRRIAQGHFEERVAVPPGEELATVAINFNQMAEALEQVEQQRVLLIGNVMHELRTPLSALGGYLEGLMDGVLPAEPETFTQMDREVRRLRRLISDLQELSAVEAGQIALDLQQFDLHEVVAHVVRQLHPQATASGITLTPKVAAPTVAVFGDPDRTTQVLINLVGNAIRYTPEGRRVEIHTQIKESFAEIAVQDDGIGIPADALPYLFERFYRVDPSRDRRTGGSGIGLTISRHLAWAMGGDLTAESDGVGQGSTFRFTLPLAP